MTRKNNLTIRIAKLAFKPGDVLVLKIDSHLTMEAKKYLQSVFEPRLPAGVKMMVLERGMDLSVLTQAEIEHRSAA